MVYSISFYTSLPCKVLILKGEQLCFSLYPCFSSFSLELLPPSFLFPPCPLPLLLRLVLALSSSSSSSSSFLPLASSSSFPSPPLPMAASGGPTSFSSAFGLVQSVTLEVGSLPSLGSSLREASQLSLCARDAVAMEHIKNEGLLAFLGSIGHSVHDVHKFLLESRHSHGKGEENAAHLDLQLGLDGPAKGVAEMAAANGLLPQGECSGPLLSPVVSSSPKVVSLALGQLPTSGQPTVSADPAVGQSTLGTNADISRSLSAAGGLALLPLAASEVVAAEVGLLSQGSCSGPMVSSVTAPVISSSSQVVSGFGQQYSLGPPTSPDAAAGFADGQSILGTWADQSLSLGAAGGAAALGPTIACVGDCDSSPALRRVVAAAPISISNSISPTLGPTLSSCAIIPPLLAVPPSISWLPWGMV